MFEQMKQMDQKKRRKNAECMEKKEAHLMKNKRRSERQRDKIKNK